MDEMLLDIAEVAERCGVAPSALRFYEKRGLVSPAGRNGLRRTYRPDVLGRLTLIACARGAGFTIAQIAAFLRATPDDAELRVQMARKALALEEDIARLSRMRDSLRCPRGGLVPHSKPNAEGFKVCRSSIRDCRPCPPRAVCFSPNAQRRTILLHNDHPALLRARRRHLAWT